MDFGNTPKKLDYQCSFSYLTGFTGSIGFSFLFLSFLLPAIASSSEAGGEETEKEESRYAGEIKNRVVHFLWCVIIPISGLTLEPSLAAFGGIGFLSFRPGRTKEQQK